MIRSDLIKFSLALCLVGISASQALAWSGYGSDWRNFYPDACEELQASTTSPQSCVMCHFTSSKDLNPYGQDYADNDYDFAAIETLDSDGDGRTNGEEINNDCTLPGDSISPVDRDSWGSLKVLFR